MTELTQLCCQLCHLQTARFHQEVIQRYPIQVVILLRVLGYLLCLKNLKAFSYLSNNQLTIVPVIDASRKYEGCVSVFDLVPVFEKIIVGNEIGGTIVLGVKSAAYSLSDIARIVETNNAKVLSSFILTDESNLDDLKVVVKINQTHLNSIVASFERYEYQIIEKYSSDEEVDPQYDNLGNFFNYLDL